jgi:hypothetical protein
VVDLQVSGPTTVDCSLSGDICYSASPTYHPHPVFCTRPQLYHSSGSTTWLELQVRLIDYLLWIHGFVDLILHGLARWLNLSCGEVWSGTESRVRVVRG